MGSGDVIPILSMLLVQLGYALMAVTSKLSLQSGMNPLVLVAYRQLSVTAFIAPLASCFERKTVCKLTIPIAFQILLCSLTGQECVRIKTKAGQSMVLGTVVG